MIPKTKIITVLTALLLITACSKKKAAVSQDKGTDTTTTMTTSIPIPTKEESIEGIYASNECDLSVKITKTKEGYVYYLKTDARKVNGKATFTKTESGEKYLVLEGIKWDEYEGGISNQEDSDSVSSKELKIPIGIDAGYVTDTLTIQNYGNAMNSYTKISECGSKYIQLIKSNSKK